MALCKRLVARLDIKGSRLIKGIRYEGLRVLGDPCQAAMRYANQGADEILYIDTVASLYGRNSLTDLLRSTSEQLFIPITAGGGVRSVDDAAALLAAGADKIAVNTAALKRPQLITELAEAFGSQCVVASIQARRTGPDTWEAMSECGRERSGRDVIVWIDELQKLGAGELLITSIDKDGTCSGPDRELCMAVENIARIPTILAGGFSDAAHVASALASKNSASSIAIGAALHYEKISISALKDHLILTSSAPSIRPLSLCPANTIMAELSTSLLEVKIGVVDYGIGNQQSILNALTILGANALLSSQQAVLEQCDILVLPGVGSFPYGMAQLHERKLDIFLRDWAVKANPLLGICLGMQMLFELGEEFETVPGIGLIPGRVIKLQETTPEGNKVYLPHMGWNQITCTPDAPSFKTFDNSYQYFVHSFAAADVDPKSVIYTSSYGGNEITAAVHHGSVIGLQFHPERSGVDGLRLLSSTVKQLLPND